MPLALLFTACAASREEPGPLPAQEEAGSVHLAVLSVAPWQAYVAALQPKFTLTADGALQQVLTIGQVSSNDELSATSVEVGVGVAESGGPGKPPAKKPAAPAHAGGGRPDIRPGVAAAVANPKRDAHTAYANAAALYQEVQLLNRYLKDAAIPKDCTAYVVRLQVTLLPRRRDAPYDAYSTLSFFSVGKGRIAAADSMRSDDDPGEPATGPRVLPLLVTDNLEMAAASRTREKIQELALALGGSSGSVAGSLGVESTEAKLDRVAGLDLNSLLAVARVSDNTLMVRLGAMQQGSTRFAMVPRTHNVSMVVLIPDGGKAGLQLLARTVFKDAITGEALPQRTPERIEELLLDVGRPHGVGDIELLRKLSLLARQNKATEFMSAAAVAKVEYPLELWVDLVGVSAGGQYSSVVVDLEDPADYLPEIPETAEAVLPDARQELEIDDDGTRCLIVIKGGRHLRQADLAARLFVGAGGSKLPVEAARVTVEGDDVIIEFESLRKQGIEVDDKNRAYLWLDDRRLGRHREFRNVRRRRTRE